MAQFDTSIYGAIQGPKVRTPAEITAERAEQDELTLKRQQMAQASRDNLALREALARFPNDLNGASDWLAQRGFGNVSMGLREQAGKAMKADADARKSRLDADEAQWKQINAIAHLITDDASLGLARQMVEASDPKLAAFLPEAFEDGAKVKTFQQMLLSAKDRMDDERARWQAELQAGTTMRGQDLTADTARRGQDLTAETSRRGQDMTAATAKAGQHVTMRGQDIAATTARRGQDISAATARRGQDLDATTTAAGTPKPDVGKIMGEIDTLSKRINTSAGGWRSVVEGLTRRGAAKTQYDNDVAEYESLVNGMIPMVARAVGHTGVLTQQDVDSVRALFPQVGDNKTLADNKMKRVKTLIGGMTPAPASTATPGGQKIGKYTVEVVGN